MSDNETLSVTLEINRQGRITVAFPCVQNDEDFELVRRTLNRLFRPSFAALLGRFLGFDAQAAK